MAHRNKIKMWPGVAIREPRTRGYLHASHAQDRRRFARRGLAVVRKCRVGPDDRAQGLAFSAAESHISEGAVGMGRRARQGVERQAQADHLSGCAAWPAAAPVRHRPHRRGRHRGWSARPDAGPIRSDRACQRAVCRAAGRCGQHRDIATPHRARARFPRQGARGTAHPVDGGDAAAHVHIPAADPQSWRISRG